MTKTFKIFLWITFIWYTIVSILAITSIISGTLLQVILSFPIVFIPVIAANKPKQIEVIVVKIFSESH